MPDPTPEERIQAAHVLMIDQQPNPVILEIG